MVLDTAKQSLIREIGCLYSRRKPLNIAAVKKYHPELIRQVFEIKPFWGWIQALRDAGIDYSQINTELDEFVE